MVQFLLDVASQVLATVLAALILRHFFRGYKMSAPRELAIP